MPNTTLPSSAASTTAQSNPVVDARLINATSVDGAAPQFKIPVNAQAIQSVESVDLDLVLTTTSGEKIILQQGALQAATQPESKIVFLGGDSITAADQVKKLGILKPVEGGSFRLKSGDASPAVAEKITGDAFGLGKELQDTMSQLTETSKQLEKVLQTLSTASLTSATDEFRNTSSGPSTGTGVQKITPQSENKFASPSPGSPPQPEVVENTNTTDVKVNSTSRTFTGNSESSFSGVTVTAVGTTTFSPARSLSQVDFTQIDVNKRIEVQLNGQTTLSVEPDGKAFATLTLPGVLNAKSMVLTTSASLPEGFTINGQTFVDGKITIANLSSLTDLKLSVSWKVGAVSANDFSVAVKFYDGTTPLDYGNAPLNFYHANTLPSETLDGNSNAKIFLSNAGYSFNITGTSSADTMLGGSGNDTLDGGAGNDELKGGAGNDTYVVDNANDVVLENASAGTDTIQSSVNYTLGTNVENLTLTGEATSGTGNDLANTIVGNDNGNSLNGAEGNDTLTGGVGQDTLNGGLGSDSMAGGGGDDTYVVDNANDVVTENGSAGTDTVQSSVNYTLGANIENLTLTGEATSGTGNDLANTIVGNDNGNSLKGAAGNDTLTGGTGNDILDGGTDADSMAGGAGNDTYVIDNLSDVVTEKVSAGTDTVQSSVNYILGANIENLTLTGESTSGTGNDLANTIVGNDNGNSLKGAAGNDTLTGGTGNDILDGGTDADSMAGGAGNDTYVIDNLSDVVTEKVSAGTDTVQSSVNYILGANIENLTLTGESTSGTGNDLANTIVGNDNGNSLKGAAGNDTLTGGTGNDILDGGTDADSMAGGAGNDTYVIDNLRDVVTENVSAGTDTVQSSVNYTLGANIEKLILTGLATSGTGNDLANIIVGNNIGDTLNGMSGNDSITGGTGNDTLIGGAGSDTLTGGGGVDTASYASATGAVTVSLATGTGTQGDASGDVLSGIANLIGSGYADNLTGNNADNTIVGGAGADTIDGGFGNDTVDYSASNLAVSVDLSLTTIQSGGDAAGDVLISIEKVIGSGLADSIWGSTGNDTLIGGADNDTFHGSAGADSIYGGTLTAAGGVDTVDYSASTSAVSVDLTKTTAQSGGDAAGDILFNISNLVGSDSGDTLTGTNAANTLSGGKGDDTIMGGGGTDSLVGGDGKDFLTGGTAADTFDLATGNTSLAGDRAIGGGGGDTFIINATQMTSIDSSTLMQGAVGGADTLKIMGTTGATIDLTASNLNSANFTSINTVDIAADNYSSTIVFNSQSIKNLVDLDGVNNVLTLKLNGNDIVKIASEPNVFYTDTRASATFYSDAAKTMQIAQVLYV